MCLLTLAALATSAGLGTATPNQDVHDPDAEAARIVEVLDLAPGDAIADVGAGYGLWTRRFARIVGPNGRVFSTEVEPEMLTKIRDRVIDADLHNVTIIFGSAADTGLPAGCCDAILLRKVYHQITDPPAMQRSLLKALRPEGLLAIIEFEPHPESEPFPGVPDNRQGRGMPKDLLIEEMASAGFEVVSEYEWRDFQWGQGFVDGYCVVFKRANR